MNKRVYAGLLCLVLGFVSLSASAQTTPEEMFQKADNYRMEGNEVEAAKWWHKAAEDLRQSAEKGDVNSQFALAYCYFYGFGVEKNDTEAAKWWHKAAELGHVDAQFALGGAYFSGVGVPQDYLQARFWYQKAAEQGSKAAKSVLEDMDFEGL